eukprot:g18621.t1
MGPTRTSEHTTSLAAPLPRAEQDRILASLREAAEVERLPKEKSRDDELADKLAKMRARETSEEDYALAEKEVDAFVATYLRAASRDGAGKKACSRPPPRLCVVLDMDCFFAAAELRDAEKSLRERPVAIVDLGAVCTANYVARRYGVGVMRVQYARELCRLQKVALVELKCDYAKYGEASKDVQRVLRRSRRFLHSESKHRGIGPNFALAKMASNVNKPDGQFCCCLREDVRQALVASEKSMFHDPKAREEQLSNAALRPRLDAARKAKNLCPADWSSLASPSKQESVGQERSFGREVRDLGVVKSRLKELSERVAEELANLKLEGRTVTLRLKKAKTFEYKAWSKGFGSGSGRGGKASTKNFFAHRWSDIYDTAVELLEGGRGGTNTKTTNLGSTSTGGTKEAAWASCPHGVWLAGVTVSNCRPVTPTSHTPCGENKNENEEFFAESREKLGRGNSSLCARLWQLESEEEEEGVVEPAGEQEHGTAD